MPADMFFSLSGQSRKEPAKTALFGGILDINHSVTGISKAAFGSYLDKALLIQRPAASRKVVTEQSARPAESGKVLPASPRRSAEPPEPQEAIEPREPIANGAHKLSHKSEPVSSPKTQPQQQQASDTKPGDTAKDADQQAASAEQQAAVATTSAQTAGMVTKPGQALTSESVTRQSVAVDQQELLVGLQRLQKFLQQSLQDLSATNPLREKLNGFAEQIQQWQEQLANGEQSPEAILADLTELVESLADMPALQAQFSIMVNNVVAEVEKRLSNAGNAKAQQPEVVTKTSAGAVVKETEILLPEAVKKTPEVDRVSVKPELPDSSKSPDAVSFEKTKDAESSPFKAKFFTAVSAAENPQQGTEFPKMENAGLLAEGKLALRLQQALAQLQSGGEVATSTGTAKSTTQHAGGGLFSAGFGQIPTAGQNTAVSSLPSINMQQHFSKPGFPMELGQRLMMMVSQKLQAAEIRLEPPELGPMKVQIKMHQEQAHVVFNSQHLPVRDALEQAIPRLKEMFEQNGLSLGNVDVQDQTAQHSQADQEAGTGNGDLDLAGGETDGLEADDEVAQVISSDRLVDYYA